MKVIREDETCFHFACPIEKEKALFVDIRIERKENTWEWSYFLAVNEKGEFSWIKFKLENEKFISKIAPEKETKLAHQAFCNIFKEIKKNQKYRVKILQTLNNTHFNLWNSL